MGTRVVFDCNMYVQALRSPDGPAGRCVQLALDAKMVAERVEEFIQAIESVAIVLDGFPEMFRYDRDPDDAHYVNLALAAEAKLIVSRDRDLLDLMDLTKPDGAEFHRNFPDLLIVDPIQFLRGMGQ